MLDSHRIVYRYVKPKAEESTDLSAILKEQLKNQTRSWIGLKAYRNGVDTLAEYKASKLIIAAEIEQIKKAARGSRKRLSMFHQMMIRSCWIAYEMSMRSSHQMS